MRIGWRLAAVGGLVALMFSLLLLRMWVLQVTDIAVALETVESQQIRTVTIEAPRGDIFDRDGKEIMAGTVASLRVVVDRKLVLAEDEPGLIQNLSALLGIPAADIQQEFIDRGSGARFPLGDEISQSTGVFVLENNERFPGVTIELIPGDAVALMLGEHATKEAVAKLRDYLGLDRPLLVRYVEYLGKLLTGDLGRSIQQNRPVKIGDLVRI